MYERGGRPEDYAKIPVSAPRIRAVTEIAPEDAHEMLIAQERTLRRMSLVSESQLRYVFCC